MAIEMPSITVRVAVIPVMGRYLVEMYESSNVAGDGRTEQEAVEAFRRNFIRHVLMAREVGGPMFNGDRSRVGHGWLRDVEIPRFRIQKRIDPPRPGG